ncbi:hypothetical protein QQF64_006156 [Cirrhinus molitorella]|uniref:Small ribosomal subunit protein bS6m n=1 Tax=Cirrhinus molitorella TaxID=172907 RepID=A0ABR3ME82_9TELE
MPRYELCVILKAMQRPETAAVLRRTVETLFERGAVVRSLENLGERRLPYKISKHDSRHTHGGYFSIDFHASPKIVSELAVLWNTSRESKDCRIQINDCEDGLI